jgi:hypothetical protein
VFKLLGPYRIKNFWKSLEEWETQDTANHDRLEYHFQIPTYLKTKPTQLIKNFCLYFKFKAMVLKIIWYSSPCYHIFYRNNSCWNLKKFTSLPWIYTNGILYETFWQYELILTCEWISESQWVHTVENFHSGNDSLTLALVLRVS